MNHTLLYQINTRILLGELGRELGRGATFDDVPDARLDEAAARGFTWIWLLGVWQTGDAGRRVSRALPDLRAAYARELPDVREEDVDGSPFAVSAYQPAAAFGGVEALARLRARMRQRGLRLMLDFVPNHVALDHPWVTEHPEFLIAGSEEDLAREPDSFVRLGDGARGRGRVLAHGRDPFFPAWSDTLQVNYRHAGARAAMIAELGRIATWCDGVRCDMAMLMQPDVFQRTWGDRALPADGTPPADGRFWPDAIQTVRRGHPDFLFVAEVYWDREWELQQAGFDFTYDKRLYDRLRAGAAPPVREHLRAAPEFQDRSLRFLENHDEPRAAAVFTPPEVHRAAAIITFLVPGMHLIHEGQLEGRKVHISVHLGRRFSERPDAEVVAFYDRLLTCLRRPEVGRGGAWRLHETTPVWDGSASAAGFIVSSWCAAERRLVAVVNFAPAGGQCYARLDLPGLDGRPVELVDLMGDARYQRDGSALARGGLYLDLPAWGYHVFDVRPG